MCRLHFTVSHIITVRYIISFVSVFTNAKAEIPFHERQNKRIPNTIRLIALLCPPFPLSFPENSFFKKSLRLRILEIGKKLNLSWFDLECFIEKEFFKANSVNSSKFEAFSNQKFFEKYTHESKKCLRCALFFS